MAQQSQVQLGEKTQRFGSESKSKRQETGWRQRKTKWVITAHSWACMWRSLGIHSFLYNTDEKTDTQNKVGSGQGCRARFGPQLPGG